MKWNYKVAGLETQRNEGGFGSSNEVKINKQINSNLLVMNNTRAILESMVRTEVSFYRRKEKLLFAHRMAHCKINTQQEILHQKIKQWEILEKDKFNEECKKYFIHYYINNR